jgi:hypothetical protein
MATVPGKATCWGISHPCAFSASTAIASRNELAIAAISLKALMRHQYQRSRYSRPVPAPIDSSRSNAVRADSSTSVIRAAATIRPAVTTRPACT